MEPTPKVDIGLIARVEKTAAVLGILASIVSLVTGDPKVIGGVIIGAGIGWTNFYGVRLLVQRGLAVPDERRAVFAAFAAKFLVLITIVIVVLVTIGIDPLAFIIGFSSTVVAVMLVPLLNPLFPGNTPPEVDSESDSPS